jgi:hypothetical protein
LPGIKPKRWQKDKKYMYHKPFAPSDFIIPEMLDAGAFKLKPLTMKDAEKDFEAI